MHDRKAAENPTDPDRDTGKTFLDGGMHCPNASSIVIYRKVSRLAGLYYLMTFCSFFVVVIYEQAQLSYGQFIISEAQ